MNELDKYKKMLRVEFISPVYCGGAIRKGGEQATIELYKFNENCMIALDKKGAPLEKQPEFDKYKVDKLLKEERKNKAAKAKETRFVKKEEDESDFFDPSSQEEAAEEKAEEAKEDSGADSFA